MHFSAAAVFAVAAPLMAAAAPMLAERASDLRSSAVTLYNPPPRLWNDATDSAQPCGGISFNGTRTPFPLSGGNISMVVHADATSLQFNYAAIEDPRKNSDFKMLVHEATSTTFRGHHCDGAPDFAALGFSAGQKLTIQAQWRAGTRSTTLYQCADVELVDPANYVQPRSAMCFNGALDVATADYNDYSDHLSSGLSKGAKAGIAVGSVIGGLALIAAAFFGYKGYQAKKNPPFNPYAHNRTGEDATLAGSASGPDMVQKA